MRRIRDEALRGTPRGEAYIRLLRYHNRELVKLLVRHPRLLQHSDRTVRLVLQDLDARDPAAATLSETTAREVTYLMLQAGRYASPGLRALLRTLTAAVRDFVERPIGEALRGR